jgi:hypothetical protein
VEESLATLTDCVRRMEGSIADLNGHCVCGEGVVRGARRARESSAPITPRGGSAERGRAVRAGSGGDEDWVLPDGWRREWSARKQAPYYFHAATRAYSWKFPTGEIFPGEGETSGEGEGGLRRGRGRRARGSQNFTCTEP